MRVVHNGQVVGQWEEVDVPVGQERIMDQGREPMGNQKDERRREEHN